MKNQLQSADLEFMDSDDKGGCEKGRRPSIMLSLLLFSTHKDIMPLSLRYYMTQMDRIPVSML